MATGAPPWTWPWRRAPGRQVSAAWVANLYSKLGDNDRAFQWLESALAERQGDCLFLGSAPAYEGSRRDPRFAGVAKRLRIDPVGTARS